MHSVVKGDSAGRLAATLYERIVAGDDLDLALNQARIMIDQLQGIDLRRSWDWALPYLRVKVSPDQVLGKAPIVFRLDAEAGQVDEFRTSALFVGAVTERRRFLEMLQPDRAGKSNLIVVSGERGIGKTTLILRCLDWMARRGRLLKYVDLASHERFDVISFLRLLCSGDSHSLISKPLPLEAMSRFYQTLNAVTAGANSSDSSEVDAFPVFPQWASPDGRARLLPSDSRSEDAIGDLLRVFLLALKNVPAAARREMATAVESTDSAAAANILADQRSFLIVIDSLGVDSLETSGFRAIVVPQLLIPIARGDTANLLVVLIAGTSDLLSLGLDPLRQLADRLELSAYACRDFESLAREYFDRLSSLPGNRTKGVTEKDWAEVVSQVEKHLVAKNTAWRPEILHLLSRLLLANREDQHASEGEK